MVSPGYLRRALESTKTIELLAAIEHERWARWQRYVHDKCERREDGALLIHPDLVAHWETQIETPYVELPEHEKDSDRQQVLSYLPTIIEALSLHRLS